MSQNNEKGLLQPAAVALLGVVSLFINFDGLDGKYDFFGGLPSSHGIPELPTAYINGVVSGGVAAGGFATFAERLIRRMKD